MNDDIARLRAIYLQQKHETLNSPVSMGAADLLVDMRLHAPKDKEKTLSLKQLFTFMVSLFGV